MIFETKRLYSDIPLPFKKRKTDAGYDIYAAETKIIWPLTTRTLLSNHSIDIFDGKFGFIQSRSGIRKRGMIIDGVIDAGFQGTFGLIISNVNIIPRRIKKGERVAQIIFLDYSEVEMNEVDEFSRETERGTDGGVWRNDYER